MRNTALPALTGIRFYAALLVFLTHVPHLPGMEWLWTEHNVVFHLGHLGVSLFFVLSGFILTYNYAATFEDGIFASNYGRFVWNRFTKIYPVHLLTLLLCLPIQIFSPNLPLNWWSVPFHLSLTQSLLPFSDPPYYAHLNMPAWSISCEWFFYLLAPIAISLTVSRRGRIWGLLGLATYAAIILGILNRISNQTNFEYFFLYFAPTRLIDFLCGVFVAARFCSGSEPTIRACTILELAGIGLLIAGAAWKPLAPQLLSGGILYIPGAAVLIYGLAGGKGLFASHLSRPSLLALGTASFSLYLLHMPIIRIAKGILLMLHRELASPSAMVFGALVVFLVAQAAALIVFKHVEIPLQNSLRAISFRLRQSSPRLQHP